MNLKDLGNLTCLKNERTCNLSLKQYAIFHWKNSSLFQGRIGRASSGSKRNFRYSWMFPESAWLPNSSYPNPRTTFLSESLDSKAVWISSSSSLADLTRSQIIEMSMIIRKMSVVPLIIASFIDFDFSLHWALQLFSSECCILDSECKWSSWIFVWVEGIILFFIIFNGVRMMFYRPEGSLWTKYYTIADCPSV